MIRYDNKQPDGQKRTVLHKHRHQSAPHFAWNTFFATTLFLLCLAILWWFCFRINQGNSRFVWVSCRCQYKTKLQQAHSPDNQDRVGQFEVFSHNILIKQGKKLCDVWGNADKNKQELGELIPWYGSTGKEPSPNDHKIQQELLNQQDPGICG